MMRCDSRSERAGKMKDCLSGEQRQYFRVMSSVAAIEAPPLFAFILSSLRFGCPFVMCEWKCSLTYKSAEL